MSYFPVSHSSELYTSEGWATPSNKQVVLTLDGWQELNLTQTTAELYQLKSEKYPILLNEHQFTTSMKLLQPKFQKPQEELPELGFITGAFQNQKIVTDHPLIQSAESKGFVKKTDLSGITCYDVKHTIPMSPYDIPKYSPNTNNAIIAGILSKYRIRSKPEGRVVRVSVDDARKLDYITPFSSYTLHFLGTGQVCLTQKKVKPGFTGYQLTRVSCVTLPTCFVRQARLHYWHLTD